MPRRWQHWRAHQRHAIGHGGRRPVALDREATPFTGDRIFADDIREDLDLPFLELPHTTNDLAAGYQLSDIVRGYRTLTRRGHGPVAAAPDPTLSLLALVPLSHLLRWSIADLKRAFLSPTGTPLLCKGHYGTP
ncbi:Imm61 family immunity protein [Mycobacterium adipatum]|uniref:Imm61 family immunity protein n=1 Tax=Mycobacterium adipatum TaxID=1682113 RepID=UPI0009EDE004|nr:Imm61 family immunity protein [Mycobacterium adipatum]